MEWGKERHRPPAKGQRGLDRERHDGVQAHGAVVRLKRAGGPAAAGGAAPGAPGGGRGYTSRVRAAAAGRGAGAAAAAGGRRAAAAAMPAGGASQSRSQAFMPSYRNLLPSGRTGYEQGTLCPGHDLTL